MQIVQTSLFLRHAKRLHKNQKKDLDSAVRDIMNNPEVGQEKKGDLSGVRVYKFKMVGQLTLLAYQIDFEQATLQLLSFGSHENFYRDLKR